MLISSLKGAQCLHRIWQVLDTPEARLGLIPATHVLVAFKQEAPKRESKERFMRCAGRIKVKNSPPGMRSAREFQSTSRMPNPAAFILLEYSGLIAKALPQKKQSWWISTTSSGDFQPKKILINGSPSICNLLDSRGQ